MGCKVSFFYSGNGVLIAEYALMRAAGVGEENRDNKWTVSRCWMLDAGYEMMVSLR